MSTLNHPRLADVLREKREDANPPLSQTQVGLALAEAGIRPNTQPQISKLEKGYVNFRDVWPDPEHRLRILQIYGFTHNELSTLDEQHDLGIGPYLLPRGGMPTRAAEGNKVDHVGTVSAGTGGSGVLVQPKAISVPDWIAAQFDLAFVFAANVSGDSMTCEDVAKSIPEGSIVFFHRPNEKMQPKATDIVYVHLQAEDVEVLKVFQPDRGHTVLTSYNRTAKPILVDEANPGIVQGIYLGLEAKGPRAR